jgi:acyl carrier protein
MSIMVGDNLEALWTQVLRVDSVQDDDNFFDLGGHSMSALRLSIHIRRNLRLSVLLEDINNHPTYGALTEFMRTAQPWTEEI